MKDGSTERNQGFGEANELSRLSATLDSIEEGFQVIGPDWRYVYVNAAVCHHGRRARDELLGRTMMECYPGIDGSDMFRTLARCMVERCAASMENEFVYPDGVRGTFELRFEPVSEGVAIFSIDVSARKNAEARWRTLIEAMPDGLLLVDRAGVIQLANAQCETLFGYRPDELVGRAIELLVPEPARAVHETHRARFCAAPTPRPMDRLPLVSAQRRDGAEVPVAIALAPVDDEAGRGTIAVVRDMTEHVRVRVERERLEAQLRQAQKMDAVGRLAGGVAHDFNNMLSVVLSYAALLGAELRPDDPAREGIEEIRKAGERAAALTRQLLTFSRQQVLEPRVIDPNAVVSGMEKMLRRLIGEDIDFEAKLAERLHPVLCDPSQLEHALVNLVVNARDAMPSGGHLTIETANVRLDGEYPDTHLGVGPGDYVLLAVSDTGLGMDRETQARIFEPFFTTKEKGKGTGLGLSTVYGIVKQSSGHVWVYSEPGKGTTLKIYLPRHDATFVSAPPQPADVSRLGGSETVLLVEDDDQVRTVACGILRKGGYRVLEARSAGEALLLSEQQEDTIHLLLTDVVMPQMSGVDLARRLLAGRPDMKVLCMSGYTDEAVLHHGVVDSGLVFLQKPLTPQRLLSKVRQVIDGG